MRTTRHRPRRGWRAAARAFVLAVGGAALLACGAAPPAASFSSSQQHAAPTSPIDRIVALLPADALLLGEQHDSPEHHRIEREAVEALAARGALAAVVLEMAERGRSTRGLPREVSEADAQAALGWRQEQWPWEDYGPAVMAALRAGAPVLGANLPRAQMRAAMADAALDATVPAAALAAQREAIRDGHCGLLPETQIAPMTRIQLARDRSLARTIESALIPGKTVLLIAGAGHARRDLGVPLHLDPAVRTRVAIALVQQSGIATDLIANSESGMRAADLFLLTPALPAKDHCAALR